MKSILKPILLVLLGLSSNHILSQSIGIGTETPDPSSILDIYANDKGILIPRVTSESRMEMEPTIGLLVYDLDIDRFCFFGTNGWNELFALPTFNECGETVPFMIWPDKDGDGYGCVTDLPSKSCIILPGYATNNQDCNDGNAAINPAALDICNGIDDDCDGLVDEDQLPIKVWHDLDGDGFGDKTKPAFSVCVVGTGQVTNGLDCDDTNANVNPDAKDICNLMDDDCDFFTDEDEPPIKVWHDKDGDGFGDKTKPAFKVCVVGTAQVTNGDDCDDTDPNVNPDAKDICNLMDDDCDFFTDEDEPPIKVWHDKDGDGFGDPLKPAFRVCVVGTGQVTNGLDCDDTDPNVNPDAKDICNLKDDDCDYFVDEDEPPIKVWHDSDGDGYGDPLKPAFRVCVVGTGQVTNGLDCDDTDPNVNPDAKDICNLKDDDCDYFVDEDEPPIKVWHDSDGDGYGDPLKPAFKVCVPGTGQVTNDLDCDDTDPNVNPDAKDICNLKDDDCDCFVDEDDPPTKVWHDKDGDGYGDATKPAFKVCVPGTGQVTNGDDCDDTDANVNPAAKDICNLKDDDCDFFVDEDDPPTKVWHDNDGDGFGDPFLPAFKVCVPGTGQVTNGDDCDDSNANVNPGVLLDLCNGIDDDCDGYVDEDDYPQVYYQDNDGDGYGDLSKKAVLCTPITGYVLNGLDCDDAASDIYPGAPELVDNKDNDCNGIIEN